MFANILIEGRLRLVFCWFCIALGFQGKKSLLAEHPNTQDQRAQEELQLLEREHPVAEYSEAIRLDPYNAELFVNRANAWHLAGRLDEALVDYARAIRLKPGTARFYLLRGKAFHQE